jgi:hypothetical protein
MHKSNLHSLAFYGIAIGSVLVLFKAVSVYGENNLKAPKTISGRYNLTLVDKLPDCQKPNSLVLNIQQSGIFLNGSLSTATTKEISTAKENHSSLNGKFSNQKFLLSGKISKTDLCQLKEAQTSTGSKSQNHASDVLTLEANLNPLGGFIGDMTLNNAPKPIKVNATYQKTEEQSQSSNNQSNKH